MQDPITLKSGSQLAIGVAPFATGNKLLKTIARELASVRVDFDLSNLSNPTNRDLDSVKNAAFQLLQSDAVETVLKECMARCLYNGQRITETTWEDENARQDYLPVAWEVMKANLLPFLKSLGLSFSAKSQPETSNGPKSK